MLWFRSHSHTHPKTRPTPNDLHFWSKLTSSNTIAIVVLTLFTTMDVISHISLVVEAG